MKISPSVVGRLLGQTLAVSGEEGLQVFLHLLAKSDTLNTSLSVVSVKVEEAQNEVHQKQLEYILILGFFLKG